MSKRRANYIFYSSIASMVFVIFFVVYHRIQVNRTVDKKYVDAYFEDVFLLLGRHTATWDRYIQANEIEKRIYWMELDSIRAELNLKLIKRDALRGINKEIKIFTKL